MRYKNVDGNNKINVSISNLWWQLIRLLFSFRVNVMTQRNKLEFVEEEFCCALTISTYCIEVLKQQSTITKCLYH